MLFLLSCLVLYIGLSVSEVIANKLESGVKSWARLSSSNLCSHSVRLLTIN